MKNLLTFCLMSSAIFIGFKGKEANQIDFEYFLVGTLSDYMGREKYAVAENRVDRYYPSEKKLLMSIDSVYKKKYGDLKRISHTPKIAKEGGHELHSETLARIVNAFYIFEPSGRSVYTGILDFESLNMDSLTQTEGFYTTNFEAVYTGKLKPDLFQTEQQKISFITGAFVRFGNCSDTLCYISVPNSVSKVQVLEELLKETGCTNVRYEKIESIPFGHKVYFIPTEKLKSYFDQYLAWR